jgi:hypothetical protein
MKKERMMFSVAIGNFIAVMVKGYVTFILMLLVNIGTPVLELTPDQNSIAQATQESQQKTLDSIGGSARQHVISGRHHSLLFVRKRFDGFNA